MRNFCCPVFLLIVLGCLRAQTPDVLVLTDDERLIGHFVGSDGAKVSFKSDVLGDLTVDWSKVKELHTSGQYAVLPKGLEIRPHADTSNIPKGPIEANGQTVTVGPRTVPVGEAALIMDQATFQNGIEPPREGFQKGWTGGITAGASFVQATQQSRSFTGAVNLIRAIPVETVFPPRNRTTVNFLGTVGRVTEPGTPTVKTEIYHVDAERDQYFRGSNFYGFGQLAFDHNFSQGLSLQQMYAGGIGWTVIREANQTLDVKASVDYIHRQYREAANESLIGSNFGEALLHKFSNGATLTEQLTVYPAWNKLEAWLATANAALNVPVSKRFSFTLSAVDAYLHKPPPGFKKNSFQLITGLTYTLK